MTEWTSLLDSFPRELKTHLRKINSPEYAEKIEINNIKELQGTLYHTGRLIFIGLVISALTIAGTMSMEIETGTRIYELPVVSLTMFVLAGLLFVRFFLKNEKPAANPAS